MLFDLGLITFKRFPRQAAGYAFFKTFINPPKQIYLSRNSRFRRVSRLGISFIIEYCLDQDKPNRSGTKF